MARRKEREMKVEEYIDYALGELNYPKCGRLLILRHRESGKRKKVTHRLEERK